MGFYIPGDIPDLQSLHIKTMDHSVGTLVPTTVAFIPHQSLNELNARYSTIANALWRDTIVDAAMFRLWMVSLGRKSAHERLAHLLCELLVRFKAVGLAEDEHTCEFPMTQAELGDALGLTTVHVNRVIQDLRTDGLITLGKGSYASTIGSACGSAPSSTRSTSTSMVGRRDHDLCRARSWVAAVPQQLIAGGEAFEQKDALAGALAPRTQSSSIRASLTCAAAPSKTASPCPRRCVPFKLAAQARDHSGDPSACLARALLLVRHRPTGVLSDEQGIHRCPSLTIGFYSIDPLSRLLSVSGPRRGVRLRRIGEAAASGSSCRRSTYGWRFR